VKLQNFAYFISSILETYKMELAIPYDFLFDTKSPTKLPLLLKKPDKCNANVDTILISINARKNFEENEDNKETAAQFIERAEKSKKNILSTAPKNFLGSFSLLKFS